MYSKVYVVRTSKINDKASIQTINSEMKPFLPLPY